MFQKRCGLENTLKKVEQIVTLLVSMLQLHALKVEYFPPLIYMIGSIYL